MTFVACGILVPEAMRRASGHNRKMAAHESLNHFVAEALLNVPND
jgi:hypothetical protein